MPKTPSNQYASENIAGDEITPLLAATASGPIAEPAVPLPRGDDVNGALDVDSEEDVPLPRKQIFLLCYTRVVEPIAFFSIFPYINTMIERTGGINKEDVGFYSGLIESLFSLTQMCFMIFWGKIADRFGRKPVLAFSLFGVTIATALFGMSKTIWQMILFRCIAGLFGGTLLTVRAMISENSTKKTQATAFSYFAFAGNIGIFVGPLLGGLFEDPATKFKSTFGRVQFFHEYPYALPGFVTAAIGLSAALVATFFIEETLHLHESKNKSIETPLSTMELLRSPGVPQVVLIYIYTLLLAFGYTAVNTVFYYTPVQLGGLGFPPELIAAAIGLSGASQALWLLLVFPSMHRLIGTGGILRACAVAWPAFFLAHPICAVFLRLGLKVPFWIAGPTTLIFGSGVAMAFTAIQLAVNDIAPSHNSLGTLNAIVLALASGLRAVIPALSTSVYATGVKYHIFGGQLFWVVAVVAAGALSAIVRLLPAKAGGKAHKQRDGQA
ncbi:major facilitator superfamily domain-containing protein [Massariosphaeria phaeospora]|uniref:Major facilitator superfamily domain-containing protein n=1 Tax=Massariosphaeria phaeospora TaxID=100035 RepID=A0A7C8MKN2_9PLEO|nr:major facilitator superfamily domain-containing protein [Massariosphaeria phaeospora]